MQAHRVQATALDTFDLTATQATGVRPHLPSSLYRAPFVPDVM